MKTAWDLSLLYTSDKDPRIEKDVVHAEGIIETFAKKYGKDSKLTTPVRLAVALKDYEALMEDARSDRPIMYFAYRRELDARVVERLLRRTLPVLVGGASPVTRDRRDVSRQDGERAETKRLIFCAGCERITQRFFRDDGDRSFRRDAVNGAADATELSAGQNRSTCNNHRGQKSNATHIRLL